jgi:hypothetical protein
MAIIRRRDCDIGDKEGSKTLSETDIGDSLALVCLLSTTEYPDNLFWSVAHTFNEAYACSD